MNNIRTALLMLGLWFSHVGISAADNHPSMWMMFDEDTRVYLFGTVHSLDKQTEWYVDSVKEAFEESSSLTVELNINELDNQAMAQAIAQYGLLPPGVQLSNIVSTEVMAAMFSDLGPAGLSYDQLDRLRPWLAALQWSQVVTERLGYSAKLGVDSTLINLAKVDNKTIYELETVEDQLSALAKIDDGDIAQGLEIMRHQVPVYAELLDEIIGFWLARDQDGLDRLLRQQLATMSDDLYEQILRKRNHAWLDQIESLMDQPGIHFVAVGAGHFVGEHSLVELLQNKGIIVFPV